MRIYIDCLFLFPFSCRTNQMIPYHHFYAEQINITPVFVKAELILMCCFFAIVTIHHALALFLFIFPIMHDF